MGFLACAHTHTHTSDFKDAHYTKSIRLAGHTLNINTTLLAMKDTHLLHQSTLAGHQQKTAESLSKHQKEKLTYTLKLELNLN
jgi:hypothetical protein